MGQREMTGTTATDRSSQAEWLLIDTPGPGYAGSVASLVAAIAGTRAGRSLLESIRGTAVPLRIERPSPRTDPPNAWARLRNTGDVGAGIVLAYDPADWPSPTQHDAPAKDVVLFRLFEHALSLASGTASTEAAETAVSAIMETYLRERNGDA
jgi:hypothetical protein